MQTDDLDRRTNFRLKFMRGFCCCFLRRNLCRRHEKLEAYTLYIYTRTFSSCYENFFGSGFFSNK